MLKKFRVYYHTRRDGADSAPTSEIVEAETPNGAVNMLKRSYREHDFTVIVSKTKRAGK